jgi:CRISPR-associated protein Csd1
VVGPDILMEAIIFPFISFIGAPSPIDIAKTVYGDNKSVKDELLMSMVDRILSCIIDGRKIPLDIVNMAVHKTICREKFEDKIGFEKALSITCALYKSILLITKRRI